jgi:UbiD family decarboxylase
MGKSFKDIREHLAALDEAGKLIKIDRLINKDTELMPLVRWQFRGLPESDRKAFLFTNVVDVTGRKYDMPVAVGCLAASREIYALGLNCSIDQIPKKWMEAEKNPIDPRVVERAAVQEVVHIGKDLLSHEGLGEFPLPISTPGFDNGPYTTSSHWFTRDPETKILNIGNYRGQIKSPLRMGIALSSRNHGGIHWGKCRTKGIPLEAALVVGAPPAVAYTAPARVPYGKSELAVAGGLAGAPIDVVRCKTVDIVVPAWAEIVIEGEISTEALEPEAPFGEATGYVATRLMHPFFNVKCITHRKDPVLMNIVSQFPPSESSIMRQISAEAIYTRFLRENCNVPGVVDVTFHSLAVRQVCVIRLSKSGRADPWQAMFHVLGLNPSTGKIVVAVDEDVDPRDWDSLIWTVALRVQPHRDTQVVKNRIPSMDPSAAPVGQEVRQRADEAADCSALLIDATRKWPYPPVSLPRKEYMDRARTLWDELGLPKLQPREPWFGYELGYWSEEERDEAELALAGKHYEVGERAEKNRKKL